VGLQGANNLVNQWNANHKKENSISLAHIIYRECAKGLDGFSFASYKRIVEAAEEEGIDLTGLMNEAISTAYNLPDSIDHAGDMINGDEATYYAFIPFLETISGAPVNEMGYLDLDEATLSSLTDDPLMGYLHLENDYPIPGVEVDEDMYVEQIEISKDDAIEKIAVGTIAQGPFMDCALYKSDNCFVPGNFSYKTLQLCHASNYQCHDCGIDPYENVLIPFKPPFNKDYGFPGDSEIYIQLDYTKDHKTDPNNNISVPVCFDQEYDIIVDRCLTDNYTVDTIDRYYARLLRVADSPYFSVTDASVTKVDHPIRWSPAINANCTNGSYEVDELYLCKRETIFKSYAETAGNSAEYFRLAQGGIYEIKRLGLAPLYFAFPWNISFWYTNGPDMRVVSNKTFNQACDYYNNGAITHTGISPEYSNYGLNNFAQDAEGSVVNYSSFVFNESRNIIISTNLAEMQEFWIEEAKFWISFGPTFGHQVAQGIRTQINLNDTSPPSVDTSTLSMLCEINSTNYNGVMDLNLYNSHIDPDNNNINLLVELEYRWTNNSITYHYEEVSFDTSLSVGGPGISLFFTTNKWKGYKVKVYAL